MQRLQLVARELDRRIRDDRLSWMRWLPAQEAFLRCPDKRKLLRAGFQSMGKTTAGAAEMLFRMVGSHPFREVRPVPTRGWVICGSLMQSRIVQEKVWELVPKHLVADACEFDITRGTFRGQTPRLILKNGSIAEFRSGGAKGVNVTSGTVDWVWIDEPPESSKVYDDLQARVMRKNGDLFMTFTPLNNPVEHIKERVEKKQIKDLHFDLKPEYLIPVGSTRPLPLEDGTPMDATWIEALRLRTSPLLAPVVLDGEWETRYAGAYFDGAWRGAEGQQPHVHEDVPRGRYVLGIDYGHKPGKQIALLVVVVEDHVSGHPYAYVLDEYVDKKGSALPERDAKGIRWMLERNRIGWNHLSHVWGDRVHMPGSGSQKSNLDLSSALAKQYGIPMRDLLPAIKTVKKGKDSPDIGERWLYQAMQRGTFGVHPQCARLIEAIPKYTGRDDDTKDPIDALRYALSPYIFGWWRRGSGGTSFAVR